MTGQGSAVTELCAAVGRLIRISSVGLGSDQLLSVNEGVACQALAIACIASARRAKVGR